MYMQTQYMELQKLNFDFEDFMFCITNKMFKTAYLRLRGDLLCFACSVGRYYHTPHVERLCPLCKSDIKLEFHFLLVCQNLR